MIESWTATFCDAADIRPVTKRILDTVGPLADEKLRKLTRVVGPSPTKVTAFWHDTVCEPYVPAGTVIVSPAAAALHASLKVRPLSGTVAADAEVASTATRTAIDMSAAGSDLLAQRGSWSMVRGGA
jgi:hypothetical protein